MFQNLYYKPSNRDLSKGFQISEVCLSAFRNLSKLLQRFVKMLSEIYKIAFKDLSIDRFWALSESFRSTRRFFWEILECFQGPIGRPSEIYFFQNGLQKSIRRLSEICQHNLWDLCKCLQIYKNAFENLSEGHQRSIRRNLEIC